ncbi:unnamed protein product [Anisakis simplex]|uniref:Protein LLP homolog n=1 Tax=Anisakis simplex TaxID=6269 RepID=A0A0M3K3T7_ANISI|nr:unnamed protein product [Anisakis simplex]
MRAIKRKRLEPRELKRLEATVARLPADVVSEAVMEAEEQRRDDQAESMDTGPKGVSAGGLNLKTMKKADGSYPVWLSQRKVRQAKSKRKMVVSAKKKKSKKKR